MDSLHGRGKIVTVRRTHLAGDGSLRETPRQVEDVCEAKRKQAEEERDARRTEGKGQREGTLLAEGDWGGGAERGIHSTVLPTAEVEGDPVLLLAVPPQAGKKRQQARTFARKSRSKTAEQATFALVSEQAGELGPAGQAAPRTTHRQLESRSKHRPKPPRLIPPSQDPCQTRCAFTGRIFPGCTTLPQGLCSRSIYHYAEIPIRKRECQGT